MGSIGMLCGTSLAMMRVLSAVPCGMLSSGSIANWLRGLVALLDLSRRPQ
jgi:hypothetical protein